MDRWGNVQPGSDEAPVLLRQRCSPFVNGDCPPSEVVMRRSRARFPVRRRDRLAMAGYNVPLLIRKKLYNIMIIMKKVEIAYSFSGAVA